MADNATTSKNTKAPKGYREITILVGDNVDDATVEEAIRSLAPPVAGLVGNYADVQRGGAAVLEGGTMDDGVAPPADVDLAHQGKVAAAVEKAVEDSRTGNASSLGDSNTGASIPGGTYNVKGSK